MAWNKVKPADADLISDSASDIRDNFAAIEGGSGDFFQDKVVLKEAAGDPTVIADRHLLYGKEVGSQTELFARNDASGDSVIQMTDSGNLGSASTPIWFDTLSHDSGTTTYNENNLITAWGHFTNAGADLDASAVVGLSCVRDATGKFTVSFDTALSSANYSVIGTVMATSGSDSAHILQIHTLAAGQFQVLIRNNDGATVNRAFSVMVLGGR